MIQGGISKDNYQSDHEELLGKVGNILLNGLSSVLEAISSIAKDFHPVTMQQFIL